MLFFLVTITLGAFSQTYAKYMLKGGRKSGRMIFNNCKAAERYFTKAIALDSTKYEAYWRRGRLRQRPYYCYPELARKDIQRALKLVTKEIKESPKDTLFWVRGFMQMELNGDLSKACEDFKRAGELAEKSRLYHCSERN